MPDLYEYYVSHKIRPTFADFGDDAQLSSYAAVREAAFFRLLLPPALFQDRDVLEFGPDSGENSVVFAKWGARLTLVEPNRDAHAYIRRYFSRFGVESRLQRLDDRALMDFTTEKKFDVIDAEGFIYTVQPISAWMAKTGDCLKHHGFLIVSFMELYGGFMELLLKALYQTVARSEGTLAEVGTGKLLFQPKWDSIPHTRTIDSWFHDVIANPFVRLKYYIDPVELLRRAHEGGFRLHSSWPNYRDALRMEWIKAQYSPETDMLASIAFIEQSRLSHFLGVRCFLPAAAPELTSHLQALVRITDGLIDRASGGDCAEAVQHVDAVRHHLSSITPVASRDDLARSSAILLMIRRAFELIQGGDAESVTKFCRTDGTLIETWGMPAHYAVLQRVAD